MSKPVHILPDPPQQSVELMDISPQQAEVWLARNGHNRSLRQKHVDALARDISEGRWRFNGDAIRFAADGTLLDGQHRLHAIVKSGCPIRSIVVRGLDGGSQETMDGGSRRSAGDALRLRGHGDYSCIAAIARRVVYWERGHRWHFNNYQPTNTEIVEVVDSNPRILDAARIASKHCHTILAPTSVVGHCWYLFAQINERQADEFFDRLSTGAELPRRHPILTLRNRLTDLRQAPGKITAERHMALFCRAWNAYREGRTLTTIPVSSGRDNEVFPDPK